ncbi:hypothetical protein GCT13_26485 [Paraburkholderia sp. CNPSo 3157]|uniref:Uncharacterized protein n=1 Tax=Paraburkholderia franconis TaxID=2654983 RepID=A0A7X1TIL5_9BURK|nr:hypothetical protein [Paraburkholderia franconis]MPW20339.1 hypothetical protein [Paraburkholderia franconis]
MFRSSTSAMLSCTGAAISHLPRTHRQVDDEDNEEQEEDRNASQCLAFDRFGRLARFSSCARFTSFFSLSACLRMVTRAPCAAVKMARCPPARGSVVAPVLALF